MKPTDRIAGRHVVASVSGGKDSTAMCLYLRELDIPFEPVFMDTGWENAETYRYIREELPTYIGPIRWLRSEVALPPDLDALAQVFEVRMGHYSAMIRWVLKKGMFPSGNRRYCTEELKVRPMGAYVDSLDVDAINTVGIRAEESEARRLMPEWEDAPSASFIDAEVWRPIIAWTLDDVVAIHQRHNIMPNRSYFGGSKRVGCWPCIRSAKAEIRNIADIDPARVAIIRDLEEIVGTRMQARADAKGKTLESLPHWFQTPLKQADGKSPGWPIDKVVEWSRTAHGGRQVELFAAKPHEMGCMRWGMCDMPVGDK
jgi:3'-phosphoadenosine 5'-phosphosulfate sulfotransferase (PAPS reductase)/FAD synthetase